MNLKENDMSVLELRQPNNSEGNMSEPQNLVSIGHLCEAFQKPYMDVLNTLAERGVKPALVLNLTPYFDFDQSYKVLDANPPTIRGVSP